MSIKALTLGACLFFMLVACEPDKITDSKRGGYAETCFEIISPDPSLTPLSVAFPDEGEYSDPLQPMVAYQLEDGNRIRVYQLNQLTVEKCEG